MRRTDCRRKRGGLRGAAGLLAVAGLAVGLVLGGAQPRAQENGKVLEVRPLNYTADKLRLFYVEDLRFGRILPHALLGGYVVLDPATGYKTAYGGAIDLGDFHSRGEFVVRGKPGTNFAILLPGTVMMNTEGGQVQLTDFASAPAQFGVVGPNGSVTVYVGAVLRLAAKQAGGEYEGDYSVLLGPQ